jgi:2,3-diketo-5-methylthiopentyl-1-phosphate enolase
VTDSYGFALPESLDYRDFVIATYLYRTPASIDIRRAAHELAEMQSTGTWVTLERETDIIRERHAARVVAIWEVPDHEAAAPVDGDTRDWVIQIAYPAHNIGAQIPLLLATVYGECASLGELKLIDLHLPEAFVAAFKGPKFGLEGIRELVGATDRPLLITMLKPALGLTPKESAEVFYQAAIGGSDAVKDDELLVSHPWSHFLDRVREHERTAQHAFDETGHRTLYFVNISDRPDRLVQNAYRAIEAGASALMVDYLTVGISAVSMLADDPAIAVPILGHLAFAGAMSASPRNGVGSHLVLGKLPRLAGADTVVYPSPYGTLRFSRSEHLRLARTMTDPLHDIRPMLPTPGGGLHAGVVPRLSADLGIDYAIGAGGAVHGHPMGTAAGARAIRQAIDATVRGLSLADARGDHPELAAALDTWPEDSIDSDADGDNAAGIDLPAHVNQPALVEEPR